VRVTYRAVSCVRIDGSDGRLFRRELGAGEIPCWVSWVRLDGTDEILFSRKLGGGELSCWVSWVRNDGTDGIIFGRQLVAGEVSYWLVASYMTGRTADCLLGSWVGESYRAG